MKLREIASRIGAHLERFEADPDICFGASMAAKYVRPDVYATRTCLQIRYVSVREYRQLTKADAIDYLAWLDAGNVGTHWDWLSEMEKTT